MSSQYGLYKLGCRTCYNAYYRTQQKCKFEQIAKNKLSSDYSLQLGSMKAESLVIADQHAAVNWSLVLVHTARHATKICFVGSFLKFFAMFYKINIL